MIWRKTSSTPLSIFFSAFSITASAETFSYSNVLDDLKKDPSFDPNDFKIDSDDYSLNVIQIAESDDGKLFLYIHQPNFEFSNACVIFARNIILGKRYVNKTRFIQYAHSPQRGF